MSGHEARDYWDNWGLLLLWTSFLLAPTAWGFDELLSYALVKPACAGGHDGLLIAVPLAALAMTIAGGWIGWSCLTQLRDQASSEGGRTVDRSYFVAIVAIGFNALIALLILTAAAAPMVVSPCE